jgi:hypothetical protein
MIASVPSVDFPAYFWAASVSLWDSAPNVAY